MNGGGYRIEVLPLELTVHLKLDFLVKCQNNNRTNNLSDQFDQGRGLARTGGGTDNCIASTG